IEPFGFRPMFAIGVLPLLTLVPIAYAVLPESADFLRSKGKHDQAHRTALRYGLAENATPHGESDEDGRRAGLRDLLRRPLLTTAIVFALAGLIGQLFIYGLSTWLPEIMRSAGYPLGSALSFLATMSIGAIAGATVMSICADRIGPRTVAMWGFGIGVLSLVTMSLAPPTPVLYVAVALAGVGANGTAVILNGFIATWFPAAVRATALGSIMTVARLGGIIGPILGGLIVAAGVDVKWSFYVFVVPAAIGIGLVLLLPRRHPDGRTLGAAPDPQPAPGRGGQAWPTTPPRPRARPCTATPAPSTPATSRHSPPCSPARWSSNASTGPARGVTPCSRSTAACSTAPRCGANTSSRTSWPSRTARTALR